MGDQSNNATAMRVLTVLTAILALVGGMAAIVRPLHLQIASQDKQIADLKSDLITHIKENDHPWGVVAQIATLQEKFTEVETQFQAFREREDLIQERDASRLKKLEDWVDWQTKEKLNQLQKQNGLKR